MSSMEIKHFIEDIGLFYEQLGMPRMAGRILGALLISTPPAQSISDLSQTLMTSKSSISIMARFLIEMGLIEKVASPIPRRDYYRFKPGGWVLYMENWFDLMRELHAITERGLILMKDESEQMKSRLEEAHSLFSTLEDEMPAILSKISGNMNNLSRG